MARDVSAAHHARVTAVGADPECRIPTACNRASADFVISSPLILEEYERIVPAHQQARRPRAAE